MCILYMELEEIHTMLEEVICLLKAQERKNSFETGKPGCRHKIYYSTVTELEYQLKALKELGVLQDE